MFKITIFLHPVYLLPFITIFTTITAFPVSASKTKVIISKKNCGQLIHHQIYSDIDFEPGVDIRGKKMKRVEYFGDERLTLPKDFSFKLNLDIARIYGLDANGLSAVMSVGRIKLKGRTIYLNDRKLNAKDSLAITTKCQKVIQIP